MTRFSTGLPSNRSGSPKSTTSPRRTFAPDVFAMTSRSPGAYVGSIDPPEGMTVV